MEVTLVMLVEAKLTPDQLRFNFVAAMATDSAQQSRFSLRCVEAAGGALLGKSADVED